MAEESLGNAVLIQAFGREQAEIARLNELERLATATPDPAKDVPAQTSARVIVVSSDEAEEGKGSDGGG